MNATDILAELARCTLAARQPGQPAPVYRAIDEAVQKLVGHKLFTLLVVDGQEVARVYSSNPKDYPVSGRKPMNRTPWGDIVLRDRKTWIARSYDDIKGAFFDHELIRSLGCESCVNVPIVYDDKVIGTMNVLHQAAWFDEGKAAAMGAFAPLLVAPFVAAARP
ncbi:MAG: GAF domain-containing protein [Alphaproteobacteria bacterium]|nr:GAF domain-containing protein [Alphaproteobacteria bacterium]